LRKINTTGIDDILKNNQLIVYPNPNCGAFTVQSASEGGYSILNELGQPFIHFKFNIANQYAVNI